MSAAKRFEVFTLSSNMLCEYSDGSFTTLVFGFVPNTRLELPKGYTHFGVVVDGEITLSHLNRVRYLQKGDFFSVVGPALIESKGLGMVSAAKGYTGFNLFGGPLEEKGRLRYIDGCTDTLLVPPVRKGDPCFNHLHFPTDIDQTPHTHPSVRTGIVFRGRGECMALDDTIPLIEGNAFIIRTNTLHSFRTNSQSMDVIAFHPDSDTGMTDDDHPMVNRTIVEGVSARHIENIRTQGS